MPMTKTNNKLMRDLEPMVRERPFLTARNGKKRTVAQHENDLTFIADRYVRGATVPEMVKELNENRTYQLTPDMIYYDLKVIHTRWVHSYLLDFNEVKAKELAHIDALEREYWIAWKNSLEPSEIIDTEKIDDSHGNSRGTAVPSYSRTKIKKRQKGSYGNPDFLTGIQWCIEQRCKIMGLLISTQNINVSWRKQAEEQGIDPEGIVDELVKQFVSAASSTGQVDGTGDPRSLGSGK